LGKLLNLFVDICLLRAGPQDLPVSPFLLWLTALLSLISGALVIVNTFGSLAAAGMAQAVDMLLLLGLLRISLLLFNRGARFLQAATALMGTSVLINLLAMPLQLLIYPDPSASFLGELGVLFYLAVVIWALVIIGHIFRCALDIRLMMGVAIALGYFLSVSALVQSLLPVT
jgi:hypothetical protein